MNNHEQVRAKIESVGLFVGGMGSQDEKQNTYHHGQQQDQQGFGTAKETVVVVAGGVPVGVGVANVGVHNRALAPGLVEKRGRFHVPGKLEH